MDTALFLFDLNTIFISSDCGRIGPFWWLNSDTEPLQYFGEDYVRWGSFGFGPHPGHVVLRAVEQDRRLSRFSSKLAKVASEDTNG